MLGVLNVEGKTFTFSEKAGNESDSRVYSVHVKKKCDLYDKTDDYGENVLRSWNDDEGTICFHTEWEGKLGDATPSDAKVKKFVDNMSSMTALTEVQILDEQSLRFVEKLVRSGEPEQLKLELPIDQAVSGNGIHKFINEASTRQWTARIAIALINEDTCSYKQEYVQEFLLDLTPVNELFIAIKCDRNDREYEQQAEIFNNEFFETLITTKNHNHVAVENTLGADFYNTVMNRCLGTTREKVWKSVEFNVEYTLLTMFMGAISIPVDINEGKLTFDTSKLKSGIDKNYYNGYLYISEMQLHCFFLKEDINGLAIYVGPEVHRDGRLLTEGVFTLRIERNVPEYWAWREYIKHRR